MQVRPAVDACSWCALIYMVEDAVRIYGRGGAMTTAQTGVAVVTSHNNAAVPIRMRICGCAVLFVAKETWDVVICDPPSFAPNKAAVPKAQASYERLFEMAARVTTRCARGL
jgi:23S rRNA (cytosine1962-C5)-methyltransferase